MKYKKETEEGMHGKTAHYWIGYVILMNLYRLLVRSVREGDLPLYKFCLSQISDLFFTFNQPNYARWAVRYHGNLLKLKESLPEVYKSFSKGFFGIKRTNKKFSRLPVDLTLEQTINADAASQKVGITNLTNSISARQKWADSHYIRTEIISNLNDDLNLSSKDDISKELKQSRIEKDKSDLLKLIDTAKGTMNPFNFNLDKNTLYNIGTGKGASTETSDFLLNYKKIGETAKEQFIQEVISSLERFEQPIKRQKVRTFASDLGVKKLTSKDNKIKAVTMMKDLFGSILCMSIERDIDLKVIFSYPLTPVPLSLGHLDGTIHKTPKAALLGHLEKFAVSEKLNKKSATIVDAMFYLRLQTNLPETFGGVSRHIFKALCQMSYKNVGFAISWLFLN